MTESHLGYSPFARDFHSENLKNTQVFPEKNSTLRKFQTFVSQWNIPGEHFFVFFVAFCLAWITLGQPRPAAAETAQPVATWKVPDSLGSDRWQVNLLERTLLLSSVHSNWLHAYSLQGGVLWSRPLLWPVSERIAEISGLFLLQHSGHPPWLLQPQTGDVRLSLAEAGWVMPFDESTWLHISPEGRIQNLSRDWLEPKLLGQLRLARGDRWMGPPLLREGVLYINSAQGEFSRVEFSPQFKVVAMRPIERPLVPLRDHPQGVVTVSVTGKISLRRPRASWTQGFEGWANCYGANGEILAQPEVDPQGNLYLATRRFVYSWDSAGKLRWKKLLACSTRVSWSSDKLYVTDDSPALLQLDPVSGNLEERLPLKASAACNPSIWEGNLALVLALGEVHLFRLPLSR